ncbi:hypothetical protein CRYUN_Cryun07bG0125200 [Craigia yunnanensis]
MSSRKLSPVLAILAVVLFCQSVHSQLQIGFYKDTCSLVEFIVKEEVRKAFIRDRGVAAGLMRMHFHDCFVRVSGMSHLLIHLYLYHRVVMDQFSSIPLPPAKHRKTPLPITLVYEGTKMEDLAMMSLLEEEMAELHLPQIRGNLAPPTFNVNQLTQLFENKGFTQEEMVTLSGGHTIGRSHCTSFSDRLYNFSGTSMQDPSLDPKYAALLKQQCPQSSTNPNLVVPMTSSPSIIDVGYYVDILANMGLFMSDHTLPTSPVTANQVAQNAKNPMQWKSKFAAAMVKMGQLDVLTGTAGEIRAKYRVINS